MGNTWLTAVAKFAFAAMALHYSGVAEPLLAHFGYAHAAAASGPDPQPSVSMRQAAVPTTLPLFPPMASAAAAVPEPLAAAIASAPPALLTAARAPRSPAAKHTATPRTASATSPKEKALQPTAAALDPGAVGEAKLRINSRPWSQVFIDGTLVGHTPKIDLRVSAGPHRIRLVNPDLQLSKVLELQATAGETISRVELLSD